MFKDSRIIYNDKMIEKIKEEIEAGDGWFIESKEKVWKSDAFPMIMESAIYPFEYFDLLYRNAKQIQKVFKLYRNSENFKNEFDDEVCFFIDETQRALFVALEKASQRNSTQPLIKFGELLFESFDCYYMAKSELEDYKVKVDRFRYLYNK